MGVPTPQCLKTQPSKGWSMVNHVGVYVLLSGIRFLFHHKKAPVFTSQNRDPGWSTGLRECADTRSRSWPACIRRQVGTPIAPHDLLRSLRWTPVGVGPQPGYTRRLGKQ